MNKPQKREGFVADDEAAAKSGPSPAPVIEHQEAEAEDDAPVVVPDQWPLVIKLMHKPIQKTLTETVSELTFREPTAGDIMRCGGNPCRIEITELGHGSVAYNPVIDDMKMLRLMASLSGVLEPFLQKMDPRDYNSCAHRLRRFFLPEQGIW